MISGRGYGFEHMDALPRRSIARAPDVVIGWRRWPGDDAIRRNVRDHIVPLSLEGWFGDRRRVRAVFVAVDDPDSGADERAAPGGVVAIEGVDDWPLRPRGVGPARCYTLPLEGWGES